MKLWNVLVLVLTAVILTAIAATIAATKSSEKTIKATRFELVDDTGKVRGIWAAEPNAVSFMLMDNTGKLRGAWLAGPNGVDFILMDKFSRLPDKFGGIMINVSPKRKDISLQEDGGTRVVLNLSMIDKKPRIRVKDGDSAIYLGIKNSRPEIEFEKDGRAITLLHENIKRIEKKAKTMEMRFRQLLAILRSANWETKTTSLEDETKVGQLSIGMHKSKVLEVYGEPDSISASTLDSETIYETWIYDGFRFIMFENDIVDRFYNF